jgi:chemotaxis protein methyltransferase CheR
MIVAIGSGEVERFRSAIARRYGLLFDDSKLGYLAEVLARRTNSSGASATTYLERFEACEPWHEELRALAQELTVGETYFFRHFDQFRAFAELAVPDRLSARGGVRRLSILSAGCASGEEPYSLGILLQAKLPGHLCEASIRAVDVNPAALERARRGRYSAWALRETPADIQRRSFRQEGREFLIDPGIRALVQFEEHNLASDRADLWPESVYDIVFCRNVLMYFSPEQAQAVVARITRALAPGGYLFLGHAETLRGLSLDYHLRHTHQTFYYQRKDVLEPTRSAVAHTPESPIAEASTDVGWTTTWLETVRRTSERIQALVDDPKNPAEGKLHASDGSTAGLELGITFELLKQERFSDALESMRELPTQRARDPDALLLRAALLTHSGKLGLAERTCQELLAIDDLNAGAHYLLALCRESEGDRQGAADHHQRATYLDPAFAMPRLHLGLLAQRAGAREAARRELRHAVSLIQREDASRLLLFGGGFSREALLALCRTELARAGGNA